MNKDCKIEYVGEWENECALCSFNHTDKCFQQNCPKHRVFRDKKDKWVYLSGAIAGHDIDERKALFKAAQTDLERQGYKVVNPFQNSIPDNLHWKVHMKRDIEMLLKCDYIYMMYGWELSKGCKLELDVASSCNIQLLGVEQ